MLAGAFAKAALVAIVSAHAPAVHVTVAPGDSLSKIAVQDCGGKADDWTGIYQHNKAVIGSDPNLIIPGQRLKVVCTDPRSLLALGSVPQHPASSSGKIWGVTYGYPYKCGDGDGDGWDMPCSKLHKEGQQGSQARLAAAPAAPPAGGGIYSYSALESLWEAAGGPSFAASSAAAVAECESGGNPRAYNPSGASGLWQILGSVVPGNLFDPMVNALNAVSKFRASNDTFAQWVCQP